MRSAKLCGFIILVSCFIVIVFDRAGLTEGAGFFGPQSSEKHQEWGFDFVETFDGLQDWRGTQSGSVTDQSDMPKLSSGSQSAWGWYSYWGNMPTGHTWIANHGSDKVWGETGKSLCIDLDDEVQGKGPSRFGLYFGDGSPTSGYEEIYIFYMVKIQKNQWPTSISDSKVGSYSESSFPNYAYFASWKFGTMNMGMSGVHNYGGSSTTYSPYHIIPHIKPSGGKLCLKLEPYGVDNFSGDDSIENYIGDKWFGVEFQLSAPIFLLTEDLELTEGAETYSVKSGDMVGVVFSIKLIFGPIANP